MKVRTDEAVLKKLLRSNGCEFVSLGCNCDVAHLLRYSGLRKKAYPFDWCITPNETIVTLIENDFSDFVNVNNLTFSEPHKALFFEGEGGRTVESDKVVVTAYCSRYNMSFPHDFPDSNSDTCSRVVDKYNARISRFVDLMKGDKVVVFILKPEVDAHNQSFIERMENVLIMKYPDLKFHIYFFDDFKRIANSSLRQCFFIFLKRKVQRANQFLRRVFD